MEAEVQEENNYFFSDLDYEIQRKNKIQRLKTMSYGQH